MVDPFLKDATAEERTTCDKGIDRVAGKLVSEGGVPRPPNCTPRDAERTHKQPGFLEDCQETTLPAVVHDPEQPVYEVLESFNFANRPGIPDPAACHAIPQPRVAASAAHPGVEGPIIVAVHGL